MIPLDKDSPGAKHGIPDFLRTENLAPLTDEQRKRLDEVMAQTRQEAAFGAVKRSDDPGTLALRAEIEQQRQRTPRAPRAENASATPRVSREGLVSVATLAAEYDMIPREARAALRAAKVAKPAHGWAFTSGSDTEKTIRAALAAAKTTPKQPRGERTPRAARSKAPAIPPPSDTTWSASKKDKAKWKRQHKSSSATPTASAPSKPSSAAPKKQSSTRKKSATASRPKPTRSSSKSKKR